MYVVVEPSAAGVVLHDVDRAGTVQKSARLPDGGLPVVVRSRRSEDVRWVWADTHRTYPPLLAAGVRVDRCVDLRLRHAILRGHPLCPDFPDGPSGWDGPRPAALQPEPADDVVGLFDLEPPHTYDDDARHTLAEFLAQQRTLDRLRAANSEAAARLNLLLAAESAGALTAAEMTHVGIPWDASEHDRLLSELLGPRPAPGSRPRLLEAKLTQIRAALNAPTLNPDSPTELLRALQHAGVPVKTTRSWELKQNNHPVIEPLLEYKKLARLMAANGWHWLNTWVRSGRFHPVYVPGGVITGRWAADGGGALQLPHQVRSAVRASPGWKLVSADAAQLEPRILAAMSGDRTMAQAGVGEDMYAGMVATGAVQTRDQAKIGMLGAMYGGTTGESGRMLPRLRAAFPRAIALVEHAATTGELGEHVQTWLGRTSPTPDPSTSQTSRSQTRSWGRFTRNFIVQGTAAEWALVWIATIRTRLHALTGPTAGSGTNDTHGRSGGRLWDGPHLVFFLHDEVLIHTPAHQAQDVAQIVQDSAAEAGRLLFDRPQPDRVGAHDVVRVDFPVSVVVVDSYDQAD